MEAGKPPPRLRTSTSKGRNMAEEGIWISHLKGGAQCLRTLWCTGRGAAPKASRTLRTVWRTQGPVAGVMGSVDHHLFLTTWQVLLDLFHTVCKYHDKPWLLHHVISHVLVLTGHYHHSLFARDALGHVVLIVAPVHLSRF